MTLVGGEDIALAAIILGVSSTTLIAIVKIWVSRPSARPASIPSEVDDRLMRIEQAVDTIAVEVERISEAQRFTSKVLADRLPASLPGAVPGGSTS